MSITARPIDDLENDLVVNYYQSYNHSTAFNWTAINPAGVSLLIFRNAPYIQPNGQPGVGIVNAFNQALALGPYGIVGSDASGSTYARQRQLNITNTTSYDVNDNLTIKNIAGYQELEVSSRTDTDGTPFRILDGNTKVPLTARATIPSWQRPISPFRRPSSARDANRDRTCPTPRNCRRRASFSTIGCLTRSVRSISIGRAALAEHPGLQFDGRQRRRRRGYRLLFQSCRRRLCAGHLSISATWIPGLSFTGGYRYNWDKKELRQDGYSPTLPNPANLSQHLLTSSVGLEGNFHAPTYTLNLSYQYTPTTMFYVTDSKGYTTGGFNINGPGALAVYQPEYLDNVEIGVKSDWEVMGIKARTNLGAYYGMYDNVQTQLPVAVSPTVFQVLTTNAATAHIQGVETEITVLPTDDLELNANIAYLYDQYDTYLVATPMGLQNMNNTPFTSAPRWSGNLRAAYTLPIDEAYGQMTFNAVLSYQTRQSSTPSEPRLPTYDTPGFENLDINLVWKNPMGYQGVTATAYGTNVTSNDRTNGPFQVYSALGVYGFAPKAPAMFGFRFRYDFGSPGEETAAAAAYTPPAAVAPMQAPKSYLVFFDFNKSDLTPQAVSIVDQAAHNATGVTKLEVTGHTDTVGSDAYNLRLSRRRAESVASQLEKDGIPSSEIEIIAKGKRDLLVPTADGVKEPQNRRVQIVYSGGPTS